MGSSASRVYVLVLDMYIYTRYISYIYTRYISYTYIYIYYLVVVER